MLDILEMKRKNEWLKNQFLIFGDRFVIKTFCNMKIPVKFIGTTRQTAKNFLNSEIIWGHK